MTSTQRKSRGPAANCFKLKAADSSETCTGPKENANEPPATGVATSPRPHEDDGVHADHQVDDNPQTAEPGDSRPGAGGQPDVVVDRNLSGSLTAVASSAYLSLAAAHHCSGATVPTPRTSSPIPQRLSQRCPQNAKVRSTTFRVNDAAGEVKMTNEDGQVGEPQSRSDVAGQQRQSKRPTIQKTISRLKSYLGLTGACSGPGTAERGRADDATAAAVKSDGGTQRGRLVPSAGEARSSGRRSRCQSEPLDHATASLLSAGSARQHQLLDKYAPRSTGGQLKSGGTRAAGRGDGVVETRSRPASRRSADDVAVNTVIPGVRVRIAPRRQLSHDEPGATAATAAAAGGPHVSWLQEARERGRANVERWLNQNRLETNAPSDGTAAGKPSRSAARHRRRQRRHAHAHAHAHDVLRWYAGCGAPTSRGGDTDTSQLSKLERSASETDLRQAECFRSRGGAAMTSYPGTPAGDKAERSEDSAADSRLGPSLLQFVAEVIEGLEQRARATYDDSSTADWSGFPATPGAAQRTPRLLQQRYQLAARQTKNPSSQAREDTAGNSQDVELHRTVADGLTAKHAESSGKLVRQRALSDVGSAAVRETASGYGTLVDSSTLPLEDQSDVLPAGRCSVAVLKQRLLRAVEGRSGGHAAALRAGTAGLRRKAIAVSAEDKNLANAASKNASPSRRQQQPPAVYIDCTTDGVLMNVDRQQFEYDVRAEQPQTDSVLEGARMALRRSDELRSGTFATLQHVIRLQSDEIERLKGMLVADNNNNNNNSNADDGKREHEAALQLPEGHSECNAAPAETSNTMKPST